ncbi:MAG: site-specific DNA-methyltransferase [Clostridia bacterium]|nr:site-specific DNA-methyltransferase [Clostridia bacterium]
MQKTGKLELTWVGKYDEVVVEPRILIEDPSKSYGDPNSENMLIHGDNLIALQALQQDYAGKIKCIYIDPPYNTGSAFEYYDDGLEHSVWLSMMKPRLQLLYSLLRDDGYIFVQIDDNEHAYLKILMDEVFGRNNFVNEIIWKRKGGSVNPSVKLNNNVDYILLYQKSNKAAINLIYTLDDEDTQRYIKERFTSVDENGRRYQASPIISPSYSPSLIYDYKGYKSPPNGWSLSREKMEEFDREGRLYFPADKTKRIRRKQFLDEYKGQPIGNLWTDIYVINSMSNERTGFDGGQKPEKLIERVLKLATNPGDIVLDSFLGSGTTAAVAHKMGRKYIGIEMGDHCYTHCKVRLDKVVDGEPGGISKSVNWQGGGGYKFYELAPSLLVKNPVLPVYQINPEYNFEMLCEAICKIEGFRYKVDGVYHGFSSEKRFIHITKEFINAEYIKTVAATLGEDQSLLIYGTKIQSGLRLPDNIEVKKIPKDLLEKCTFESEVR